MGTFTHTKLTACKYELTGAYMPLLVGIASPCVELHVLFLVPRFVVPLAFTAGRDESSGTTAHAHCVFA